MIFDLIKQYCDREGISISAFERRCNLGNGAVSKWAQGATPTIKTLKKIAAVINLPLDYILKECFR